MQTNKKSPLKDKPLRYVGQSLDEEINKLISEDAASYLFACGLMIILAGNEWWRYFRHLELSPRLYTVLAAIFICFSFYKIRKILKKVKSLKLGRDGERAVGQYLESLRENGCRIFHDLLGENFNLDHVIISQKGIFVVETKTYSKPAKGEPSISFDGKSLQIKGIGKINEPVIQVISASKWLKRILTETTGKIFSVNPVILFPGWYITSTVEGKKSGIWVLEPKALPTYINNQPDLLSQSDMMLASFHVSRYIRTKEALKTK